MRRISDRQPVWHTDIPMEMSGIHRALRYIRAENCDSVQNIILAAFHNTNTRSCSTCIPASRTITADASCSHYQITSRPDGKMRQISDGAAQMERVADRPAGPLMELVSPVTAAINDASYRTGWFNDRVCIAPEP